MRSSEIVRRLILSLVRFFDRLLSRSDGSRAVTLLESGTIERMVPMKFRGTRQEKRMQGGA